MSTSFPAVSTRRTSHITAVMLLMTAAFMQARRYGTTIASGTRTVPQSSASVVVLPSILGWGDSRR